MSSLNHQRCKNTQQNTVAMFACKTPCADCPYRCDAPLQKWDVAEFRDLLTNDASEHGAVYMCHQQNGSICVGFLMNQDERDFPSNRLRMALMLDDVTREYLDNLFCDSPMFSSIEEMCQANYPEEFKEVTS